MSTFKNISLSRRNWIHGTFAASLLWNVSTVLGKSEKTRVPTFRVRAVVKVNGEVRLKSQVADQRNNTGKAMTAKSVPMQATTDLEFEEQYELGPSRSACKSYLRMAKAETEIQVDRHVTKTKLRDNCYDIVRLGTDQGMLTACLDNPLFAAEKDLLQIPVSSMFIDGIITKKEVKITDKWDIDSETACRIFGLDAILDGKLTACLVDANQDVAQIELEGSLNGSVNQVASSITIEAKAQLDRKLGFISWFAANIEETREIGEAEPGFKVLAQFQMKRAKIDDLSNGESLESITSRIPTIDSAELLQFQSDFGYFRFLASHRWNTYRDVGEEATYRFVVDNQRVAQCNITNMIDFEPGRQLSLEGFIGDVKTSLGSTLIEVLESSEKVTVNRLKAMKVVSRSMAQDVPVFWIHYHLSNDDGRRVTVVFMMNEEQVETFASEDSQIIATFELINWPTKLDRKALERSSTENATSEVKATTSAVSQPSTRPKLSR
jgi:hypothetical protein